MIGTQRQSLEAMFNPTTMFNPVTRLNPDFFPKRSVVV